MEPVFQSSQLCPSAVWPLDHRQVPRATCLAKHGDLSAALPTKAGRKKAPGSRMGPPHLVRKGDRERTTQCLTPVPAPRAPNTQVAGCQHPSDSQRGRAVPISLFGPWRSAAPKPLKRNFEEVLWCFFTNQGMAGQTCRDASRSRSATGGGDPQLEKFRAGVKPSPSHS